MSAGFVLLGSEISGIRQGFGISTAKGSGKEECVHGQQQELLRARNQEPAIVVLSGLQGVVNFQPAF